MYSIVYVSTAQPDLEEIAIKKMMQEFQEFNNSRNIKGILMYSRGNFFQVLESEFRNRQVILDLYENIKRDGRHYDIIKILEKRTVAPCFSKYNTAFKAIYKSSNIKELYGFLKQEEKYNPEGYSKIAYLSQKFLALI
ncbi:MAG: BLUF domain-containing protein [Bacteroidota bacterium]